MKNCQKLFLEKSLINYASNEIAEQKTQLMEYHKFIQNQEQNISELQKNRKLDMQRIESLNEQQKRNNNDATTKIMELERKIVKLNKLIPAVIVEGIIIALLIVLIML